MENPTLTLVLTLDQVNAILTSLGDGPYRAVQPIISSIQEQATKQLQPAPEAPATTDVTDAPVD